MRLPDDVTILRPTAADEFGNPGADFTGATSTTVKGFEVTSGTVFLNPGVDVALGDRVEVNGRTWSVSKEPTVVRSPSKTVLVILSDLDPLEG